jgi:hypothetical protein
VADSLGGSSTVVRIALLGTGMHSNSAVGAVNVAKKQLFITCVCMGLQGWWLELTRMPVCNADAV